MVKPIECNSEIGITIGLIDNLIVTARVLRIRLDFNSMSIGSKRDKYQPIRNALHDLVTCKELREILNDDNAMQIIHDAARVLNKND